MEHRNDHHVQEKHCHMSADSISKHTLLKKISESLNSYKPLIIIILFCFMIPIFQIRPLEPQKFMYNFMGYFFIFLSLFKFFDLKGFVNGFSTYDLLTKRFRIYGYFYPFIELGLGLAYLGQYNLLMINWITLIVMTISGIGVLKSILSGQKVKCACLGTVLNVPLSTVSILENFGMSMMAAYKLNFFF